MKRPFSARPRLRIVPRRLTAEQRQRRLARIEGRSTKTATGCWLYPSVRNYLDPYVDIVNDHGRREQWTMRRYVWALTNGDIPDGAIVVRRCRPRNCVAPGHPTLWHQVDWVGSGPDSTAVRP